ncbi:formimidoylglutamase [Halosolutus gelatinilyticus]|uniref:formimidoylglutamase n=1 Tax=Halosolutus gelatinilyticus TaxID=2931975 RepID=UPI001FF58B62|nr:formimidoylglutamase [Halosolutus gelatinilyticus]
MSRDAFDDDDVRFERPDWNGWCGPSTDPRDRQFGDGIEPLTLESAAEADAVLVGEPYDGAVIGRRGAREGPVAIRRSLAGVKTAHLTTGDAIRRRSSGPRIGDLGDLVLPDADVAAVQARVRTGAERIHDLGPLPVFLGGDNSLTFGNVAPLLDDRAVGVVNFDAHLDCRVPDDGPTSGTPYRQLLDAGLETYVCVGARHFETSRTYVEYVRDRDGTIVPPEAFDDGVDAVAERVRDAIADVDALYLSVDCDVLDATVAPGVSAPTPGGLTTRELFAAVGRLAGDDRLAGLEIVECAPPLDSAGRTVDAAARTIAHALYGYLNREDTR